ncbi:MAG: hypothetical protein ABIG63_08915, partial [Chloroflexota bacterium]
RSPPTISRCLTQGSERLLVKGTIASSVFDRYSTPKQPKKVQASDWMKAGSKTNVTLYEQCIAMPNYNGVLSLLWTEDDEYDY